MVSSLAAGSLAGASRGRGVRAAMRWLAMAAIVGVATIVGAAVAAAVGVARLAARVSIPSGQLCVGAACAGLVATPALMFALARWPTRPSGRAAAPAGVSSRLDADRPRPLVDGG